MIIQKFSKKEIDIMKILQVFVEYKKGFALSETLILFAIVSIVSLSTISVAFGSSCVKVGSKCYSRASLIKTPMKKAECEASKSKLGPLNCFDDDYYAAAAKICGGVSKMTTEDDLVAIANYIYNTSDIKPFSEKTSLKKNTTRAASLGLSGNVSVYTNQGFEIGYPVYVISRDFHASYTGFKSHNRFYPGPLVMCKVK